MAFSPCPLRDTFIKCKWRRFVTGDMQFAILPDHLWRRGYARLHGAEPRAHRGTHKQESPPCGGLVEILRESYWCAEGCSVSGVDNGAMGCVPVTPTSGNGRSSASASTWSIVYTNCSFMALRRFSGTSG